MYLFSLSVRVRNFRINPVTKQECLAPSGRVKFKNRLPMMFFHYHYQVCPAQVFQRKLGSSVRCKINALLLHHDQSGFICRMVDQGTNAN